MEYLVCIGFMIVTSILNSLFFGDIAAKIAELQRDAVMD